MWLWLMIWAHIVEVVVLPWVPAKQRPLWVRVSVPSTCARFSMEKLCSLNHASSAWEAGMAGVKTTSVCSLSRQGAGIWSTSSS